LAGKGMSGVRLAWVGPGRRQAPAAEKVAETAAAFLGLRLHLASLALLLHYQDPPAVTHDSTDELAVVDDLWVIHIYLFCTFAVMKADRLAAGCMPSIMDCVCMPLLQAAAAALSLDV